MIKKFLLVLLLAYPVMAQLTIYDPLSGRLIGGIPVATLPPGSGCVPMGGASGQVLLDDGAGGCTPAAATGTGSPVKATSPTLVTPALGTPSAAVLTNATGLPIAGITGLGSGVGTFLATPSSANLATAVTNETGSGALVFATSPALVTPDLGTPSAGVLTNATGLPEGGLSLTDITTNNSSTSKHGFLLKLDNNSAHYMNGQGAWTTPAGGGTGCVPSGTLGQVLVDSGSGACNSSSGVTISGTVLTATGGVVTGTSPPSVTAGTGGLWAGPEGTAASVCAASAVDCVYMDSTQHGILANFNNAGYKPLVQGPTSQTTGRVASWSGTNGGLLADAGFLAADTVRSVSPGAGIAHFAGSTQVATSSAVVSADLNITTTTCSNQFVRSVSSGAVGTCASIAQADLPATTKARAIAFSIGDPGGSALAAASTTTAYVTVPFACTISAYNLAIDAGTITVKFWKIATGTAIPTSSNSINTSGVAIATGTAIHSATVSDFTSTAVTKDDIVAMNVITVATAKYVSGVLQCDQ